jgi:DNA-binding CsgD family transcriptional regulator
MLGLASEAMSSGPDERFALSSREKQLLRRLAKGMSDVDIAYQIGGRPDQISEQRQRLCKKLGISSQSKLVEAAARLAPWPERSWLARSARMDRRKVSAL